MNAAHAATASEREDQLAKVPFFDGLTREALSLIAQENPAEDLSVAGTA